MFGCGVTGRARTASRIRALTSSRADGGIVAIQFKFYAETHTMQKHDIDLFISASGKESFTHRAL
jgi:predicted helicase